MSRRTDGSLRLFGSLNHRSHLGRRRGSLSGAGEGASHNASAENPKSIKASASTMIRVIACLQNGTSVRLNSEVLSNRCADARRASTGGAHLQVSCRDCLSDDEG